MLGGWHLKNNRLASGLYMDTHTQFLKLTQFSLIKPITSATLQKLGKEDSKLETYVGY